MLDPTQLAAAGPWAVVIAMGIALGTAFVKGWIVPGFVYDREVKRGDEAIAALAKSVEALAEEVRRDRRTGRRPDATP